ncbi:LysR family transcriptional regulator [Vibrio natriegens]|uniref:helix-turn-helix domain-containing protein n=1 Tax=Vibrio natriegens TaxID=691 RepID=UPI00159460E7|nr:LysR family transcriptional regulator [Vibrio natriegens]NVC96172.1 LysR family transcriptional regulator [Vibrio natriegens]
MIFNYNLLKPLSLLLETRSISDAAKQMSTSSSAISRTLRNLREIFEDELLTRKNGRMELTPKAISLRAKVNNIVSEINSLSEELAFEPSKTVATV